MYFIPLFVGITGRMEVVTAHMGEMPVLMVGAMCTGKFLIECFDLSLILVKKNCIW